jgi:hypothetical protein
MLPAQPQFLCEYVTGIAANLEVRTKQTKAYNKH